MIQTDLAAPTISRTLQAFTDEAPAERTPILELMQRAARETEDGKRIADVGCGNSPYRELFDHTEYFTIDWDQSVHEGARHVDLVASAEDIPLPDGSFDAVLLTQVLEHVAEPLKVLTEQFRILKPGGRLYMSVPLVWELHEMPHDYFRYTESAIRHLMTQSGFEHIEIVPKCDSFTSLAQIMRNVAWTIGSADDGLSRSRELARDQILELADEMAQLAPLDISRVLPLGYCAIGVRP